MRIASKAKNQLIIGVLVTFLSLSLPTRVFALRAESDQLAQLLGEARNEAGELAKDADETESLVRNDVSWQTHAEMLEGVKEHVNNMGRIVDKLTATRSSGSELQEQAVDRILPLLKELAANTTAAINYLNQNQARPIGEPYTQYLKENADNLVTVKPLATPADLKKKIEDALVRSAEVDANNITVEVQGSKAILKGKVRSWAERKEAERTAWLAPGITSVDNQIRFF